MNGIISVPQNNSDALCLLFIRLLLWFQVFSLCVNTTDFDYLMTRLKFNWEKENFSNYLTVQRICRLLGRSSTLLSIPIYRSSYSYTELGLRQMFSVATSKYAKTC